MKRKTGFLFLMFLAAAVFAAESAEKNPWQERKSRRKNTAKAAQELSDAARATRVARNVRDHLEYQARVVSYALKQKQLTPGEMRRIDAVRNNIEKYLARIDEKGSLTKQDADKLHAEISRGYRLIWFLRRNPQGNQVRMTIFGKEFVLKEEYRGKISRGSQLSQKELADILHAYYRAYRIRDRMQNSSLPDDQKQRMKDEAVRILSEYFTFELPEKENEKK